MKCQMCVSNPANAQIIKRPNYMYMYVSNPANEQIIVSKCIINQCMYVSGMYVYTRSIIVSKCYSSGPAAFVTARVPLHGPRILINGVVPCVPAT